MDKRKDEAIAHLSYHDMAYIKLNFRHTVVSLIDSALAYSRQSLT
jgi:hypothetical protein